MSDERPKKRRKKRKAAPSAPAQDLTYARKRAMVMFVATLLIVLGIFGVRYISRAAPGETCITPADCRSGMCVKSTAIRVGGGGGMVDIRRCSNECTTDKDCPSGMQCSDEVGVIDRLSGEATSQMRACAPRL